jgi:hypothetical protein
MPAPTSCPVSDIDRVLASYINSRDDTLKIRRTLSKYLTAAIRPASAATQNQHLNHAYPHNCSVLATNPPGLQNSRKAYLTVIRSHLAAHKRHEETQASMLQLQNQNTFGSPGEDDSQYDSEVTRSYVALLRQRRRFSELQVIKESLEKLLDASPLHGSEDPKDLVMKALGEQPTLPPERLDKIARSEDDGSLTLKVKKEVLEARSSMDRAIAARAEAQSASRTTSSMKEQVHALGCARQEIVEWVQEELAKMEEESGFLEDASPVKRAIDEVPSPHLTDSDSQIRDSYNQYTSSRSIAISSHASIQQPYITHAAAADRCNVDQDVGVPEPESARSPRLTMAKALPHLSELSQCNTNERSLLQQAVYLQTQISAANEETSQALLRLSEESHLLPSGTKGIEAWGKTSADVQTVNEDFVRAQLHDSRQDIGNITAIVDLCSWQSKVLSSG